MLQPGLEMANIPVSPVPFDPHDADPPSYLAPLRWRPNGCYWNPWARPGRDLGNHGPSTNQGRTAYQKALATDQRTRTSSCLLGGIARRLQVDAQVPGDAGDLLLGKSREEVRN